MTPTEKTHFVSSGAISSCSQLCKAACKGLRQVRLLLGDHMRQNPILYAGEPSFQVYGPETLSTVSKFAPHDVLPVSGALAIGLVHDQSIPFTATQGPPSRPRTSNEMCRTTLEHDARCNWCSCLFPSTHVRVRAMYGALEMLRAMKAGSLQVRTAKPSAFRPVQEDVCESKGLADELQGKTPRKQTHQDDDNSVDAATTGQESSPLLSAKHRIRVVATTGSTICTKPLARKMRHGMRTLTRPSLCASARLSKARGLAA